jgi:ATP-binding cassette, subfamily B, bacterial
MTRARLRIAWDLYRPVRRLLALYVFMVVLGTLVEGMALAAIVPLIQGTGAGGFGGFYGGIIDAVGLDPASEVSLVLVVGALFVVRSAVQYCSTLVAGVMVRRQAVRLQVDMFRQYLRLRWEVLLGISQGEANMLLDHQVRKVAQFLRQAVAVFEGLVYAVGLTVVAIIVSPSNTLIAIALVGTSAVAVSVIATRVRTYATAILRTSKAQAGVLLQYARGVQALRSFDVCDEAVSDIQELAERRETLAYRSERVRALSTVLPDLLFVLALLAVVAIALRAGDGIAELGAIVALLFRVSQYLKRLSSVAQLSDTLPTVKDVHRYQKLFQANASPDPQQTTDAGLPPGAVELDHLVFRYAGAATTAVDDITNRVAPGELIGVVGSSGSGKSTLVSLIVGLLEPHEGRVRIGARPADRKGRRLAYVPQTPFILKGTIESNVRWFRSIPEERVIASCEAAGLGPLLNRLPKGLRTRVEQEGLTLSGGERQRLSLARALAGDPDILVLDEATSALDSESEAAIQEALGRMHGSVTIISIAHRLSTVLAADRIWVMEHGRIIEDAPPADLLGTSGSRFATLGSLQGIET